MSPSLRSLSDSDVLSRTLELTRRERSATLQVLLHLNEIERRRLHLKQGYASMFDYCTNSLGYSSSAAGRRIQTARCIARYPEVYALLEANEVNLTTLSEASRVIKPTNKDDLLARIRSKSQREVKAIVAEYDPQEGRPRDHIRPMVIKTARRPTLESSSTSATTAEPIVSESQVHALQTTDACENSAYSRRGSASQARSEGPTAAEGTGAVFFETIHLIKFPAGETFMQKYAHVRSMASHRLPPNPTFEQVFELALDLFLEKHDPSARRERREERKRKAATPGRAASVAAVPRKPGGRVDTVRTARYIPTEVRDQVFARDKGRCTYTGPSGRRCGSAYVLQIDHITPVARGGASTVDNLRLLCAYHNRLEAERIMGPAGDRGAT